MSATTDFVDYLQTPIGWLEITASDAGLRQVEFVDGAAKANGNEITAKAKQQLEAYFAGQEVVFDLPLAAKGTEFQQQVWQALLDIPWGETCSYADIARKIGNPKAVRAVGAANGRNPISIIVPCHRVIGSNGTLTGYAGGTDRKAFLLNLETKQTGPFAE